MKAGKKSGVFTQIFGGERDVPFGNSSFVCRKGAFQIRSRLGKSYVLLSALLGVSVILLIFVFLFGYSLPVLTSPEAELFPLDWNPPKMQFGVLPLIYGSVAVTIIALALALPLGVFTAIFTSEMLSGKTRLYVKSLLELLAGVPSIIYGLIGVVFLSTWIESVFDLQSGLTILTGGLLIAVMILPTIITLTDDALQNVPQKYRKAARGVGLQPYEVIKSAVLPIARPDIFGAALLALGRAVGETMAVMLVIGSIDRIPSPITNVLAPGQTMTSKLGRELAEAAFGSEHFSAMVFIGLLLLLIVMCLTFSAQVLLYKPGSRLYE